MVLSNLFLTSRYSHKPNTAAALGDRFVT
jgi:hypothetical protein